MDRLQDAISVRQDDGKSGVKHFVRDIKDLNFIISNISGNDDWSAWNDDLLIPLNKMKRDLQQQLFGFQTEIKPADECPQTVNLIGGVLGKEMSCEIGIAQKKS